MNETFLRLGGFRREDVLGRPFEKLLTPGSQLFLQTQYQLALLLDGAVSEVALSLAHVDGYAVPVVAHATMSRQADGSAGWIRTAVFDAAKRGSYAKELLEARREAERSQQRVRVLEGASTILSTADSEESLVTAVSELVRRAVDAYSARLLLLTGDDVGVDVGVTDGRFAEHLVPLEALWPTEARGQKERVGPDASDAPGAPGARTVSTTQLRATHAAFADTLAAHRIHSLAVAPLHDAGAVVGIIACFFRRQRDLDADEAEMLSALARYSAQALQRIRLQDDLRHAALHDQLTGLANRTLLTQHLERALATAVRHERPLALLYLDLDGFKQINDTLGHSRGDAVLVETATRMRELVRASDIIARVGGDEFVIVCAETGHDAAREIAERIRREVGSVPGATPGDQVTASIGVALLEHGDPAPSADELLRAADEAMYTSKQAGKNRVTVVRVAADLEGP